MNKLPFTISDDAEFDQPKLRDTVRFQEPAPAKWDFSKAWEALGYGLVVAGVGLAAFILATPAHANGSMGIDVKVVRVSPSITSFGDTREGRKLKADVTRDAAKHQQRMELEQQKSDNARALEADRAYYKKLADQRKARK